VIHLHIPPLRDRRQDISLLVQYFLEKYNRIFGTHITDISREVREVFLEHDWPGNVREIENVIERGINFGIVLKYNLQTFPCGNSVNNSTDAVIDAKYASFGATFADLDSNLGDSYVQANSCGHNHISPDNKVDASTGRYPEQTWYVRDFVHMRGSDDYDLLVHYILFSDEQVTVFDNEKYPQFLILDESTNTVSPLMPEEDTAPFFEQLFGANSWITVLFRFVSTLFVYLRQLQATT
jgi:hypothetical protein